MENKNGFMMIDLLLTMLMITSMAILYISNYKPVSLNYLTFLYDYLNLQSEAMVNEQQRIYMPKESVYYNAIIQFNPKGHVNKAQTIHVLDDKKWTDIVIELGSGRLVVKE